MPIVGLIVMGKRFRVKALMFTLGFFIFLLSVNTSLSAKPFINMNTDVESCKKTLWEPCLEKEDEDGKKLANKKYKQERSQDRDDRTQAKNEDGLKIIYVPVHVKENQKVDPYTGEVRSLGSNDRQDQPTTSEEYISQEIWKHTPKEFLLTDSESLMLGKLSPEGRKMPLPMLKFLLKPDDESPEQTRKDFLQYKEWVENNLSTVKGFAKNYRSQGNSALAIESMMVSKNELGKDAVKSFKAKIDSFDEGKMVRIPGKELYILYFFNSNCPYCIKMTPNVNKLVGLYPEASVLGFSRDEALEKTIAYAKSAQISFDVIKPSKDVMERFNVDQAYPRLVIVDKVTGVYVTVKGYVDMVDVNRSMFLLGKKRAIYINSESSKR